MRLAGKLKIHHNPSYMQPRLYTSEFARARMIEQQIRTADVTDERILDMLATLPREEFVADEWRRLAYADARLPLLHGHRMMAPQIEGELLQAVAPTERDEVLEIGTGSGYLTACFARLCHHVTTLEVHADQLEIANSALDRARIRNVQSVCQNVFERSDDRQFDIVAVTGSLPQYDTRFEDWLRPGGRLFVVVGDGPVMEARRISRGPGELSTDSLFETSVEPLESAPRPPPFSF